MTILENSFLVQFLAFCSNPLFLNLNALKTKILYISLNLFNFDEIWRCFILNRLGEKLFNFDEIWIYSRFHLNLKK